jgi:thymidylate synthase
MKDNQSHLTFYKNFSITRGNGKLKGALVEAENLAEATHKSIFACHDYGSRVETPKHKDGMSLGYDAPIMVGVNNPDSEPKVYFPGMHDDGRGVMQYILEVTHGIHNHWKKDEDHPERWGYTYNERFASQLPFVFQRIKADYNEKGRITGRDYHFSTWITGEDIIPEQEDPPCLQIGNIRFLMDENGQQVMNYMTIWRSRDLLKAWNENNIGQVELMKLIRDKTSDMLQIPIELGSYIDTSTSLHLYGLYVDRDNLEQQIEQMRGYKDDEELSRKFIRRIEKREDMGFFEKLSTKRWLNSVFKHRDDRDYQDALIELKKRWDIDMYKKNSRSFCCLRDSSKTKSISGKLVLG